MQLLVKHSQKKEEGGSKYHFALWAKIELDGEEEELINKYRMANAILAMPDDTRAIMWSKRGGWFGVIVACGILGAINVNMSRGPMGPALIMSFGSWLFYVGLLIAVYWGMRYLVYNMMRELVLVHDLLKGRWFFAPHVPKLIEREQEIKKMAAQFRHLLEITRTWNETHVLEIAPGVEPQLYMIERPHEVV